MKIENIFLNFYLNVRIVLKFSCLMSRSLGGFFSFCAESTMTIMSLGPSGQLDIPLSHYLSFFMMEGWKSQDKVACF